jgi:hypothetical protein
MIPRALLALTFASGAIWLLALWSSSVVSPGSSLPSSAADTFASGGLGLTKTQWEQNHAFADSDPVETYRYLYDRTHPLYWRGTEVYFWGEQGAPLENAPISRIFFNAPIVLSETTGYRGEDVTLEQMEPLIRTFLPADAVLVKTEKFPDRWDTIVQTYHSDALASRYPTLSSGKTPWSRESFSPDFGPPGYKPGTIFVDYHEGGPYVSITAGEDGTPWDYIQPPPPTRTPRPPLPEPEPTTPPIAPPLYTSIPEAVPTR